MKKENIWPAEEKENKVGKILKIFGEGKYSASGGKEKRRRKRIDNIWRRKIFGLRRRRKTKKEND